MNFVEKAKVENGRNKGLEKVGLIGGNEGMEMEVVLYSRHPLRARRSSSMIAMAIKSCRKQCSNLQFKFGRL